MRNKMISLPEELFEQLSKESNASNLITRLLIEHYKTSKIETIAEIEEAEKQIQNKRTKLNQELAEEENSLITKKEIKVKEIERVEEKKEISKTQLEEKKANIREFFKLFTQREMTEAQLNDYLYRLENHELPGGLGEYVRKLGLSIDGERETLAPA